MWDQVNEALQQSTTRVLTGFARLLPGLVALLIAVVIASLLAWLVRLVLVRTLRGLNFDQRMLAWGFTSGPEWGESTSPTILVGRVVSTVIVITGFLIGIAAFDATLTSELALRMFAYLPNVLAALLVLLVGTLLAKFLARGVLIGAVNMNLQYASLLSAGVKWLVFVMTAAMALDHLGIGGNIVHLAFAILFGGIVLALALAVGLGSKDAVSRSLERQSTRPAEVDDESFRHL